jgi:conjugative transfer region protein (TIGR03748 family)
LSGFFYYFFPQGKNMSKRFALVLTLLCFTHIVYGLDNTSIGRYLSVSNKPTHAQVDLLSQTIQVRFPQTVQTVGDAINYLLKFSGYSLIEMNKRSAALKNTLSKPLPAVDRDFGPMSLKDGLITLIGQAFNLKQDVLNRTIDFALKPQYKRDRK